MIGERDKNIVTFRQDGLLPSPSSFLAKIFCHTTQNALSLIFFLPRCHRGCNLY